MPHCFALFSLPNPRFTGSHIAAAKPNLSVARRPSQVEDQPSAAVSSASIPSTTVSVSTSITYIVFYEDMFHSQHIKLQRIFTAFL